MRLFRQGPSGSGTRILRTKGENAMNLKGRHFLKLLDYTPEEITYLLDLAAFLY